MRLRRFEIELSSKYARHARTREQNVRSGYENLDRVYWHLQFCVAVHYCELAFGLFHQDEDNCVSVWPPTATTLIFL
jgi:hypothetical protein